MKRSVWRKPAVGPGRALSASRPTPVRVDDVMRESTPAACWLGLFLEVLPSIRTHRPATARAGRAVSGGPPLNHRRKKGANDAGHGRDCDRGRGDEVKTTQAAGEQGATRRSTTTAHSSRKADGGAIVLEHELE